MSQTFQFIVQTPAGLCDPSPAIAACRAGSLGVLDLEYCTLSPQAGDLAAACAAMNRLAVQGGAPCGIKVTGSNTGLITSLLAAAPDRLGVIILAGGAPASRKTLTALTKRG